MPEFIKVCELAARAGGKVLLDWQSRIRAREKGPKDLVTEADFASQRAIREVLLEAFPQHHFVGEEEESDQPAVRLSELAPDAYCWIVDPLDGTTNYVHRLPTFAVSIALQHAGQILAGVVYDPAMDECYSAQLGGGAFLNGQRLQTSRCGQLREALVAASFSAHVPRGSPQVAQFVEVLHQCQAVRRLGSAALNLCYVAAGRLDAYWATSAKAWDVAAGILLLCEAGGVLTSLDGRQFDLQNPLLAASATPDLHQQLLQALGQAR